MQNTISFKSFNKPLNLEPIKFSLAMREEGPGWSLDKIETLEKWYRRFLFLVHLYPEKTIVPTKDIDIFWHTHILDTKKYMTDCELLFGGYFHHFPYFGMRGEKDRMDLKEAFNETEELYLNLFGESSLSSGIADCGALCNEPTPKNEDSTYLLSIRPTFPPHEEPLVTVASNNEKR
jgi:hypothetical protein